MDNLCHVILRHYRQLFGQTGTVVDMERFHRSRIPLDRFKLWRYRSYFFSCICHCQLICRAFHWLDGYQKRLSLGYRCMVVGGLYACTLRLGNRTDTGYTQCRRNDLRHRSCCFYHCHHQRVLFHCGTHRAGNRWSRQLPCRHQSNCWIFS